MSVERRRERVERDHPALSIRRQCELLSISRSGWYYAPQGDSDENLLLMREIDEQYLKTPWYGSRHMVRSLRRKGHPVNRKRIQRLMRTMGLRSLAPGPNTSRKHPAHPVCPSLLRDRLIDCGARTPTI